MEYIKLQDAEKSEVMISVKDITNSGETIDKVFKFIEKNPTLLSKEEYLIRNKSTPIMPEGIIGMMIMNTKYSINIKKATIVLIAFLLDLNLTKGLSSLALGLAGVNIKAINKIETNERCLIIDILKGEKRLEDYNYDSKECIQNDITCNFRNESICNRKIQDINEIINRLLDKEIITKTNKSYKVAY